MTIINTKRIAILTALVLSASCAHVDMRSDATLPAPMLTGTWALVAADLLDADGTRTNDYGRAPKGRLIIDAQGRYSLQIFKSERPRFASNDKAKATAAEFESAAMGSSTHFGTVQADATNGILTFNIEAASFPNWEGGSQKRSYQLVDDELSYRVPPRPDGKIPISVWRRLK